MFQLVLKFKFRLCNNCTHRKMSKVSDSQLGDGLFKQHSDFLSYFLEKQRLSHAEGGEPWPNAPPPP